MQRSIFARDDPSRFTVFLAPGLAGWVMKKGEAGEVIFTKDAQNRLTVFMLEQTP